MTSAALDRAREHMRSTNGPRSVQHIAATLRLSGPLIATLTGNWESPRRHEKDVVKNVKRTQEPSHRADMDSI